jgi:hypothetical protein
VALRVERSYPRFNKRLSIIQLGGDDTIIIFGINRLGVFGEVCNITEIKINRKFNAFTNF